MGHGFSQINTDKKIAYSFTDNELLFSAIAADDHMDPCIPCLSVSDLETDKIIRLTFIAQVLLHGNFFVKIRVNSWLFSNVQNVNKFKYEKSISQYPGNKFRCFAPQGHIPADNAQPILGPGLARHENYSQ